MIEFTAENTEGYTASELTALNAELAARLADIPADNYEMRDQVAKSFADECSRSWGVTPGGVA